MLYALYTDDKIDLGQIRWTQFIKSPTSSWKFLNISNAHFWSIVVKNARDHFKVTQMDDVQMEKFSVMNTVMFVTKNAKNFHFIGAIPEVMLSKVPTKNEIVEIY